MPQVPNNIKFGVPLMIASFVVFAITFWGLAQVIKSDEATADEGEVVEDGGGGGPVSVTVAARNLLFDKRALSANAGASLSVTLDNQDAGVLHNIAFYSNRSATQALAPGQSVGEVFAGVAQRSLSFTPPRPGSFFYRCDVHPDTMTGTLTVK